MICIGWTPEEKEYCAMMYIHCTMYDMLYSIVLLNYSIM